MIIVPLFFIPQHTFIHSFDKELLSNCHASGTFLGAEDAAVKTHRQMFPHTWNLRANEETQVNIIK